MKVPLIITKPISNHITKYNTVSQSDVEFNSRVIEIFNALDDLSLKMGFNYYFGSDGGISFSFKGSTRFVEDRNDR